MQIEKRLYLISIFVLSLSCDNAVGPEILNADVIKVFNDEVTDILFFESGETGWASSKNGDIAYYANGTWSLQEKLPSPEGYWGGSVKIYSLDFTASDDGWAVGSFKSEETYGIVYRYDGNEWEVATILDANKYAIYSVEALASDDVWFGGFGGALIHYDGSNFTEDPYSGYLSHILDIEFHTPDFGLALDTWGDILFFDGTTWIYETLPINLGCMGGEALSIVTRDDIWAVGCKTGGILQPEPLTSHFDGTRWNSITVTEDHGSFYDVFFNDWDNGWIAASSGVWHFDGKSWSFYSTGSYKPRCVTVTENGDVWIGCEEGYILKVKK